MYKRQSLGGFLFTLSLVFSILVMSSTYSTVLAVGSYNNATIADIALSYKGQWGGNACRDAGKERSGQCKQFVNCIVFIASSHTQYPVPGYNSGFKNAGGLEVPKDQAQKGDIIQVGDSDSDPSLHTAIVIQNKGNGVFNVVDSNYNRDERVTQHDWTPSDNARYWRMGTAGEMSGVGTQGLSDVNGDSRADAIVMFKDSGTAMVALSQPNNTFSSPSAWAYGHSVGADKYFFADANGDSKDDLVAFYASSGDWNVSLSSGAGFWPPVSWAHGHGVGTQKQWLADVNSDKRADIITLDKANGDWYVSLSSGSGFWSPVRWIAGHGVNSDDQQVADFNGDNKADAGAWVATNGSWTVATSNGNAFNYPPAWSSGHGLGSQKRIVGDANGDNKADSAFFFPDVGHWDIGLSSGGGFWAPTAWAHGQGIGTTNQWLADVNGDKRADMVTFDRTSGDWYVSISSGSGFWSPTRWISGHGKNS